jgi:hypothetical protein
MQYLMSSSRKLRWFCPAVCLSLCGPLTVSAEPTVYLDQEQFIAAVTALGISALHEGFENEDAWGAVRSSIVGGTFSAPQVCHLGICWTANNLISNITTGAGPALTDNWGLYAIPHGSYTDPDESCPLPGEYGDGWRASAIEGEFIAMGGWIETNTPFAKLGVYLGDYPANPVDLGETCDPPDSENCASNSVVTTQHQFWGVIEPAGFLSIEFRELEGKLEIGGGDIKYIYADDFWFAFKGSDRIFKGGFE